jgi:hypothetical protein
MEYAQDEYCNVLLALGACNSRAGTSTRGCTLRYLGRRHPDAAFQQLEQRLRDTEVLTPKELVNAGRPRTVRPQGNEDTELAAVERESWRSPRDIVRELGLCHTRVLEVLHDCRSHPYLYSRSARLFSDDCPLQMQFREWLHQHAADELFLRNKHAKRVLRVRVCSAFTNHLWARNNHHAVH